MTTTIFLTCMIFSQRKASLLRRVCADDHFHECSNFRPCGIEMQISIDAVNEYEFLFRQDRQQMNAESPVVETVPESGLFRNDPPQISIRIALLVFARMNSRTFPDPFLGHDLLAVPSSVVLI